MEQIFLQFIDDDGRSYLKGNPNGEVSAELSPP